MRTNKIAFLTAIGGLLLLGAGCISFSTGGSTTGGAADGGIFKTADKGDSWVQKAAVATAGKDKKSIMNVNIATLVQDPQDANALYIGTSDNGLLFTYDGGESWQQTAQLSRSRVDSIAVNPKDKCTVYATADNRLLKSEDCSRTWTPVYVDARPDRRTTAVAVDAYSSDTVYLGMDSGDLFRSMDAGRSWTNLHSFGNPVARISFYPTDSRRILVATRTAGIWRSDDAAENWKNLSTGYTQFGGSIEFMALSQGVSEPDVLVFASKYGLIRSRDFGETWEAIELLTPPQSALIYSVALDPKDVNVIYYGTATTFHRTANGGANWVPKKLPTSRVATQLLVDSMNSGVLFMGVTKFQ